MLDPLGKMPGKGPMPVEKTRIRIRPSQNSGVA